MAFRADEKTQEGRTSAINYLTRNLDHSNRSKSVEIVHQLIDQFGPVVECYPIWHPLLKGKETDGESFICNPDSRCGYEGLDHTIFLRDALITCPYRANKEGVKSIFESVNKLHHHCVKITAQEIDVPLYADNAFPVLIKCEWNKMLAADGTIPKSIAVPLLLESEVPCWRLSNRGETWETMRTGILGQPCGSRSSLFVNQETGQTLKSIWNALIYTGMFGPLKVG